jgi:hypothetical protein
MRKVKKGRLVTLDQIRSALARIHNASFACPITTGIFALIAARAAAEDEAEGKARITPYWRTLKSGGELNSKFPGGLPALKRRLQAEGHKVIAKGKRIVVEGWERRVVEV